MSVPDSVRPPAVCLLSGGMDSAVVLAEARAAGFAPHALTVRYGQRHAVELAAAERVARAAGVPWTVVDLDLRALGGSALTAEIDVPKDRAAAEIGAGVPATYVPARNAILLALALGHAEVVGATDLFVGVNAVDYSGYPDCRPAFLRAFEELAAVATAAGAERGTRFRVHAPLLERSKADIVRRAAELDVDLALTHTCYDPLVAADGAVRSCGRCDACRLRLAGFAAAGRVDPIAYAPEEPAQEPARGTTDEPAHEPARGTTPEAALEPSQRSGTASAAPRRPPPAPPAADAPRAAWVEHLLAVVDRLRAPDGCPWDREQTAITLAPHLVEEAHELLEALEEGDAEAARAEAGDVLMALALICRIASEEGAFDLAGAARAVAEKLVRRHPHVFAGDAGEVRDAREVLGRWEAIKRGEREAAGTDASALAGIPRTLPALQRARRLSAKAVAAGFAWTSVGGALEKVEEEVRELRGEMAAAGLLEAEVGAGARPAIDAARQERLEAELGDVLIATAFLGEYAGVDPERACRRALHRFEARFRHMEAALGARFGDTPLAGLMAAWRAAKAAEREA